MLFILAFVYLVATQDCVSNYEEGRDYFPDKIESNHAQNFEVSYFNNYKVVRNVAREEVYVLTQCGTPEPLVGEVPAGSKFFTIPLQNIALEDTTILTFVEILGLRERISHVGEFSAPFITSPCVNNMLSDGVIDILSATAETRATQMENIDALFMFSSDDNSKTVAVTATADPGVLHRAEWIEFMSLFFNAEGFATAHFEEVQSRYECHSSNVRSISDTPRVAWINYKSYKDTDPFEIEISDYKLELVEDAGGEPFGAQLSSVAFASAGDLMNVLESNNVEVVIDETFGVNSWTDFIEAFSVDPVDLVNIGFLAEGRLWRLDKLQNSIGGLDWFESSLAEPDVVLEDMISAIYPQYLDAYHDHETVWFRHVGRTPEESVIIENGECPREQYSTALNPRADSCSLIDNDPEDPEEDAGNVVSTTLAMMLFALIVSMWM